MPYPLSKDTIFNLTPPTIACTLQALYYSGMHMVVGVQLNNPSFESGYGTRGLWLVCRKASWRPQISTDHWLELVEQQQLVAVAAVDAFLVAWHLHRPLETLAADVAAVCLDGEVCSADVVAQRRCVLQLRVADVTDARLAGAIRQGLLDRRV